MIVMPLTVAIFIAATIQSFKNKAVFFILAITIFEACSNMMSVWYAMMSAYLVSDMMPPLNIASSAAQLEALWRFPFKMPAFWSADKGVLLGLLIGLLLPFTHNKIAHKSLQAAKNTMEYLLTKIFARLIPLFVLGFVVQMHASKMLDNAITNYASLILVLIVILVIYISFLFLLSSGLSYTRFTRHVKNLLPAGGISLTSGCSLSTMPWTISGASKNLNHPSFASAVIPTTTNIQQIGDCIAQTLMCSMIYLQFYGHLPDLATFSAFSVAFVLARFATAAMLGGAIFVMLPIYETYLHFNSEMIALILAFNVLLDPIITSSNVMANGALCRVFERIWLKLNRMLKRTTPMKAENFI
ncbi:MAG: dicarboxylate/amino acid:cation symporter [Candidatus Jidaibacter sp.]|nr:dicarboxylate/amino acid:cation symporter [Candidatus Jidaibacter sp.]